MPKAALPENATPQVGMVLGGTGPDGRQFQAVVDHVGDDTVKLNLNHPLAGKTLYFAIAIIRIGTAQ